MGSLRFAALAVGTALGVLSLAADPAEADPIRSIPNLQSITFYEETDTLFEHTFAADSAQMTTRLSDPLSASNSDFVGAPTEDYDVYYSDADGTFNSDGSFITITAVYSAGLPWGGGLNIAEVALNFTSGPPDRATVVSSFVTLGDNSIPGDVGNAVDGNLNTWTTMGNTIGTDQRLSVTVGDFTVGQFTGVVPEPSGMVLMASALMGLLGFARRAHRVPRT